MERIAGTRAARRPRSEGARVPGAAGRASGHGAGGPDPVARGLGAPAPLADTEDAARVYAAPAQAPAAYASGGGRVAWPVVVREASAGVATWLLPARAVQRLVPEAFEVATVLPGRTPLAIAVIDYRDNDLGDYHEVSITCFVRPRGAPRGLPWVGALRDLVRGRLGTYIWKLPVDQTFTCEAGRTIWGFPKTVESIDFHYEADRVRCRLAMEGEHVLTLSLPRGGARTLPDAETVTYTLIEGIPHRTRFTQGG